MTTNPNLPGADESDDVNGPFIQRVADAFAADDRIRSVFLTGSYGTGVNDSWSDVDLVVGVTPEHLEEVFLNWPEFASQFGPLLHLENIPGTPVITQITAPWTRWDVTLVPAPDVTTIPSNVASTVLNKDGVDLGPRLPKGAADLGMIEGLTREFVRIMGLLPVVVGRDDVVTGMAGANLARQLTLQLFIALADGNLPGGALRAKRVLAPEDYDRLAALPVAEANLPSIIAAHQACWSLFLPTAQDVLGDAFPHDYVAACSARLAGGQA